METSKQYFRASALKWLPCSRSSFQTEPEPIIQNQTVFNLPTGVIMFWLNTLILTFTITERLSVVQLTQGADGPIIEQNKE